MMDEEDKKALVKAGLMELDSKIESMSFRDIFTVLKPVEIVYASLKKLEGYIVNKAHTPKSISKVVLPPALKESVDDLEINENVDKNVKESMMEFIKVMKENYPEEYLANFVENAKTLNTGVQKRGLLYRFLGENLAGSYNSKRNILLLEEEYGDTTITHELLHMASSTKKNGIGYSGFHQYEYKPGGVSIGSAINEGYTEFLNKRLFSSTDNSYEYQVFSSMIIEKIVGKEKMEKLYFSSNLKGLIDELAKYTDEEDVMTFLADQDFLLQYLKTDRIDYIKQNHIKEALKRVNEFELKAFSKKLKAQLDTGERSSHKECFDSMSAFIQMLPVEIKVYDSRFEIISIEDMTKCAVNAFVGKTDDLVNDDKQKGHKL